MKITRQNHNPAAYRSTVDGVEFITIMKQGHNTTNGHPTRRAFTTWNDPRGISGLCCRELSIVLYYESEQEAADQIARRIVESWKK